MEVDSVVIVSLHSPREKVWGRLLSLNPSGVTVQGIDLNSYDDWVRQRQEQSAPLPERPANKPAESTAEPRPTAKKRGLSFREERELEELPARIEKWEQEQEALQTQLGDPAFYQQAKDAIATVTQQLDEVHRKLETAYERWTELESR